VGILSLQSSTNALLGILQHKLQKDHVEPLAELVADFLEAADVLKAEGFLQRDVERGM
jgi:hypothetical protein